MSKKEEYKLKIESALIESSHNLKTLYETAKNVKKFKGRDTSFYEALVELLNENKVAISGYDSKVNDVKDGRVQSFIKEGVIFEWVKTGPNEIINLLNELETSGNKSALDELKVLFCKKIREFESSCRDGWNTLLKKLDYWVLSDEIKSWKEFVEERKSELEELKKINPSKVCLSTRESKVWNRDKLKLKTVQKKFNIIEETENALKFKIRVGLGWIYKFDEVVKENPDAKYWFIKNMDDDNFKYLDDNTYLDKEGIMNPEKVLEEILLKKEVSDDKGLRDPLKVSMEVFNPRKKWFPPVEMKEDEITDMFHKILFYISIQEDSKLLKYFFSLALSDDKDSLDWFEYFIKNVPPMFPSLVNKLSDALNIIPKYEWESYKKPEDVQEGFKAHTLKRNW